MLRETRVLLAALCVQNSLALTLPRLAPGSPALPAGLSLETPRFAQAARLQQTARCTVRMQDVDFLDGYMTSDPETGERKPISLAAKEKLYLDCLDAYYNEDGKALLSDDEYEKLKLDLDFEGAAVATYTADEIKFIIANKRYSMNKAILTDSEYDTLRTKLKQAGSSVILHDAASCDPESGICKNDMQVDVGKQRLLYLPGIIGGMVVFCELSFWILHFDPILSILLGTVPVYFGGKYFTENIFAQKPLVATTSCPECNTLMNVYFGDLLSVGTDKIVDGIGPANEIEVQCPNCKAKLMANREKMLIVGEIKTAA